jgi:superfamily I DNA/RNA helicase
MFGGLKFLEAAYVKNLLALLHWAQNLRDRAAGFRAIQLLAGIGPKTVGCIVAMPRRPSCLCRPQPLHPPWHARAFPRLSLAAATAGVAGSAGNRKRAAAA